MAYDPSKPLTPYNTPITVGMRQTISNKLKTLGSKDRDKDPAGARDYLTRIGYNFSLQRPRPSKPGAKGRRDAAYQEALKRYYEQQRSMKETMAKNIPIERQKSREASLKAKQQWWANRQASKNA